MKRLIVKKELLPSIKNEQKFIYAIQLSRILGALHFNKIIHTKMDKDEKLSPSIQLNLLLNQAAVLFEGIKKFKGLKSKLKNLESYSENYDKVEKIFKEIENKNSFFNKVFCEVRNKIAFRYDRGVIKEIFKTYVDDCLMEHGDVILISAKTRLLKNANYALADNMNIHYILKPIKGRNLSDRDKFVIMARELLNLSKLFCGILEDIIPELIQGYCELKKDT